MGFDGKQCIHPNQATAANALFSRGARNLLTANEIVHAYEQRLRGSMGAASLNGKMIDAAACGRPKSLLRRID